MPEIPHKASREGDSARVHSPRRVGRWTYGDHGGYRYGWRLDDTPIVIDREIRDEPCYVVVGGRLAHQPIDRYMQGAMKWIEEHEAEYVASYA